MTPHIAHVLDGTIPLSEAALGEGKRSAARLAVMSFPKPPPPPRMPLPPSTPDPPEEKKNHLIDCFLRSFLLDSKILLLLKLPAPPGVKGKRSGDESKDAIAVADPGDKREPGPPAAAAEVSASTASTASSKVGSS